MSRTQKLKGLNAASLRLKTLNDNPYNNSGEAIGNGYVESNTELK